MKIINFRGNEFHLAESPKELKDAVKAMYFHDPTFQTHHIQGRIGIMKMLVENNLPLWGWLHGLQKSTSVVDRAVFDDHVRAMIGEDRWDSLEELAKYIKNENILFKG